MRPISQKEAEQMRETLKEIAGFYNPARVQDSGQAAALKAREVLEDLGLLYQADAGMSTKRKKTTRRTSL
jgi:hypothetical protein